MNLLLIPEYTGNFYNNVGLYWFIPVYTKNMEATYLGKLKELPVDATKHLVLKLLDLGLSRTPNVIQLISSYCLS